MVYDLCHILFKSGQICVALVRLSQQLPVATLFSLLLDEIWFNNLCVSARFRLPVLNKICRERNEYPMVNHSYTCHRFVWRAIAVYENGMLWSSLTHWEQMFHRGWLVCYARGRRDSFNLTTTQFLFPSREVRESWKRWNFKFIIRQTGATVKWLMTRSWVL